MMPGIISRIVTLVIFISLILYLAGTYGLPILAHSILGYYGFDRARVGAADIQSHAIILRDIHLATTDNGASSIKTLRVEFSYSPPYIRRLTISGADIHASWAPDTTPRIAAQPLITRDTGNQARVLTLSRLIEAMRLPDMPFEILALEDAALTIHTPQDKVRLTGEALINAKRDFTADLASDSDLLTIEMSVIGAFNPSTGALESLNIRGNSIAADHKRVSVSKAEFGLGYKHDKSAGERLNLHTQADTVTVKDIAMADLQLCAKDSSQGLDISATINRIDRGNMALNGISVRTRLSQLWPPATADIGRLTINKAALGVPITNIDSTYRISGSGPELASLEADFADGRIALKPGKDNTSYTLAADHLALGKLAEFGNVNGLVMKGSVSGRLPLRYTAEKGIIIDNGRIIGGKGGYIHYEPETYPAALQGNSTGMATTRKALRRLNLSQLELKLNGPVQGDLEARLSVKGKNPDFSDRPVHLTLNLSGAIMSAVQQGLNIGLGRPKLNAIKHKIEQ